MGSGHWHWLEFFLGVLAAAYSVTCTRPCCKPAIRRAVVVPPGCHPTQHQEFRDREHRPPIGPAGVPCWCDPGEPPKGPDTRADDSRLRTPDAGKPWKPGGHY